MSQKKGTATKEGHRVSGVLLKGAEAVAARAESKKSTTKRMMDEAQQKETMPEDVSELEKDLKVYLSEKGEANSKKSIEDIFGDS